MMFRSHSLNRFGVHFPNRYCKAFCALAAFDLYAWAQHVPAPGFRLTTSYNQETMGIKYY